MGSDAQRIGDLTPYLHALWFAPLQAPGAMALELRTTPAVNGASSRRAAARQVTAALAILGRELGWAVLPGLAVIGAMLRLNKSIAAATCRLRAEASFATTAGVFTAVSGVNRYRVQKQLQLARDERARLTRELLGGIKAVTLLPFCY